MRQTRKLSVLFPPNVSCVAKKLPKEITRGEGYRKMKWRNNLGSRGGELRWKAEASLLSFHFGDRQRRRFFRFHFGDRQRRRFFHFILGTGRGVASFVSFWGQAEASLLSFHFGDRQRRRFFRFILGTGRGVA
ncbi:hypothetical protein Bpfe_021602 [Biomphalaria pfeifferi]|uniref:Uncharacterized protein n=1 Tax=Biomphalaria pfeifferi TaxID=112525 RepID=A0AAD8B6N9_BIOPF|nr:hypothetical protein Bpfe_021602 [Biomphalaria pfeifferi]